ncbi:hypothetical protein ACHAWF_006650 [Thalassiosira exigua]
MAPRRCSSCGRVLPKSEYSSTQWSKKKDGKHVSKCKDCVAIPSSNRDSGEGDGVGSNIIKSGFGRHLLPQDNSAKYMTDEDLKSMISRLQNPDAPPHPDLGKVWTPSQTMEVTSGRICFGLSHEVESGADEDEMTFADAAHYYGDRHWDPSPHNTVARNGTWLAYKLIDRDATFDEHYAKFRGERTEDDRISGWFVCHEDVKDPVSEVRQMVYNTMREENGGNYNWGMSNNTHPFHVGLGYILVARYAMGYNMPEGCSGEEEEDKIRDDGLFVMDRSEAKKGRLEWSNCIRKMHTYGDFDIGRLKYNSEGSCEAFLFTGTAAPFQTIHFSTDGTAPLGEELEDWGCNEPDESKPKCEIATRCCVNCGEDRPKAEYSSKQWSKKKDGKCVSKCKECVAEQDDNEQQSKPRSNYDIAMERTLEDYEAELKNIVRHINLCELYLLDPNDVGEEMMKQLEKQKYHWDLCYKREELLEQIRLKKLDAEWRSQDMMKLLDLDGDNMACVLCNAQMPLDGEKEHTSFYRANRLVCCGARYCLRRCHMRDLPGVCPACNSLSITSTAALKEDLLRHAEGGKTWAQLELAERYDKVHSSVRDDEAEKLEDYQDRRHLYENKAIEWASKASDSGNILATIFLAKIRHGGGYYEPRERSVLMKRAADTGDPKSIEKYAQDVFASRDEVLKYSSLCTYYSVDEKALGSAYRTLAEECENSGGVKERQLFLFEQGALNGNHMAMVGLAYCLNNSAIARYGSTDFTKYNQLPKIYYWAKKAAETQWSEAMELLENVERNHIESNECACLNIGLCRSSEGNRTNLQKKNKRGSRKQSLFPCDRCETAYYCSDQCQRAFDAVVGHKKDCCNCSDCKTNGPYMGFADWKRPCNGPLEDGPFDNLHNELYS